jgi:hypothetical protein
LSESYSPFPKFLLPFTLKNVYIPPNKQKGHRVSGKRESQKDEEKKYYVPRISAKAACPRWRRSRRNGRGKDEKNDLGGGCDKDSRKLRRDGAYNRTRMEGITKMGDGGANENKA